MLQMVLCYDYSPRRHGTISFECIADQCRIAFKFVVQIKVVSSIIS